jgi:hypothetical protein
MKRDTMDLTTLVTACALTVDPTIMHALIWHQSSGEPWSFAVPREGQPQIYRTVREAVGAARDTQSGDATIRVGLTGLSADPRTATAAMFAPCPNIAIAARQIAQLAERCRASPPFKGDPVYCAIAVYHGSWDRPDKAFADAVRTSVANNDAPDFEMPKGASIDFAGVEYAPQPAIRDTAMVPPRVLDDRERGWSSALFPAKSRPSDRSSIDDSAKGRPAADAQKSDVTTARSTAVPPHADSLFVPRSTQRSQP